jgi:hypothetical protein
MKSSMLIGSAITGFVAVVALVAAGCSSSEAGNRHKGARQGIVEVQPSPKPIKMRYFGGPKSPMYPG